jgi:hypothetical protein
MNEIQQAIVNEHIADLRREAESLRTEQRMRHRTRDGEGSTEVKAADRHGARVRLGQWLIGVGNAVAGNS